MAGTMSRRVSRRVVPGFLIKSLSEHYNAPGRLAEYKRQFQRAFRRLGDDPSNFATELETLAQRILTLRFSYRWCETVYRWTGGVCTPHTFGQFGTEYSHD